MDGGTDRARVGGGGVTPSITPPARRRHGDRLACPRRLTETSLSLFELALTWILTIAGLTPAQGGPPRIAGIALGSTAAEVVRAVGRPDREEESLGIRFWDYNARGLTLMWHEGDAGVQGFVVREASAGPLDGVRVGDEVVELERRWGTPSRVRQEGRYRDFAHAEWVVSAEVARGRVTSLTVLRVRAPD